MQIQSLKSKPTVDDEERPELELEMYIKKRKNEIEEQRNAERLKEK